MTVTWKKEDGVTRYYGPDGGGNPLKILGKPGSASSRRRMWTGRSFMENNRSRAGRKTENRARPQMGPAPLAVWAAGAGAVLQLVVLRQIGQGGDVLFASPGLVYGVLFLAAAFAVPNGVAGAVRARMKKGKTGEVSRLFSVSLILALAVGAILAALLFFGGGWIAGRAGGRESAAVWRALALAALFAAGSGAVRGYFYGMGVSAPGVISILLEAAGGGGGRPVAGRSRTGPGGAFRPGLRHGSLQECVWSRGSGSGTGSGSGPVLWVPAAGSYGLQKGNVQSGRTEEKSGSSGTGDFCRRSFRGS